MVIKAQNISDVQYEILRNVKRKTITALDIDYIKDKKSYRIGFGVIDKNYDKLGLSMDIYDIDCSLKALFEELLKHDKEVVVVGFKNMMHDLMTIVLGRRPEGQMHLGEFYSIPDEDHDSFYNLLSEISLVNKIEYQLTLFRPETYNPKKTIRVGKFYLTDFKVNLSLKTNKTDHKNKIKLQKKIFEEFDKVYKYYAIEPVFYLIPDKASSGNISTLLIALKSPDEVEQKKKIMWDYELNNILRNTIVNLIVLLSKMRKGDIPKKYRGIVNKILTVSKIKDGMISPDFINYSSTGSVLINKYKINVVTLSKLLFELYIASRDDDSVISKLIKYVIEFVNKNTTVRIYDLWFTLRADKKAVFVQFTELESLFNMALDKAGEYFGVYKTKYSQTVDYLENDVRLHLLLTYTKVVIESVIRVLYPDSLSLLYESGDPLTINNIAKIIIGNSMDEQFVFDVLKINRKKISEIAYSVAKVLSKYSQSFKIVSFNISKRKTLFMNASILSLNPFYMLKKTLAVSGVIISHKRVQDVAGVSIAQSEVPPFNAEEVTPEFIRKETNKWVNWVKSKIDTRKYNAYVYYIIDKHPEITKEKFVIDPPALLPPSVIVNLLKIGYKPEVSGVMIIIVDKEGEIKARQIQAHRLKMLGNYFEIMKIISTIPIPYAHLISSFILEQLNSINAYNLILMMIKNKYMSKRASTYIHPSIKNYSYLVMSIISAEIFKLLLKTHIDMKNKTGFILYGTANSLSIQNELIVNIKATTLQKDSFLLERFDIKNINIKALFIDNVTSIRILTFSTPIQHLLDEKLSIEELYNTINYNIISKYEINLVGDKKVIKKTSSRL